MESMRRVERVKSTVLKPKITRGNRVEGMPSQSRLRVKGRGVIWAVELKKIKTETVMKVWEKNEVIVGLSAPIAAVERADVLHSDEGLRINFVNPTLNVIYISSFDAAAYHRYCTIFPTTRNFGCGVASIANGLYDGVATA
jgi:hypothetical protein